MRKPRLITALAVSAALVAAGCGGDDDDEAGGRTTLNWWLFEEDDAGAFPDTLKQRFEEANPDIELNITRYPEDQYGIKVDTAIAAGQAPDLVLVYGPDQMKEGLLLPLDDVVAGENLDLSTFNQGIVGDGGDFSCSFEGTLYCLGSYQAAVAMFYNKDMFDAAGIDYPATWPPMTVGEYVDLACQLTDSDAGVYGGAYGDAMTFIPWEVVVSPDGRTAEGFVNGPMSVQTHQIAARGQQEGCAPTLDIVDPWQQGVSFFADGKLATVVTDFLNLDVIENAGINYGVAAVPSPPGVEPFFYVWSDSVGILKDSEHPEEAKRFLAFLVTEGQRIRAESDDRIPLDNVIAEEINWDQDVPGRMQGLEIMSHARASVFVPERWDAYAPIFDAWGLIVGGEQDAQSALDDVASAIQENLDAAWESWEED